MGKEVLFDRVVVVGLGGIWYRLAVILGEHCLHMEQAPKELLLVDGDKFEDKNTVRQGISKDDVGRFKAEWWTERMKRRFPALGLKPCNEFLVPDNVSELITDRTIVVLAVDNHATRKLASKRVQELTNTVLISGGNELYDGNAQLYVRLEGKSRTRPIEKVHAEIENPPDKNPGEMSCEERLALPGGGQTANANMAVALCMSRMFEDLMSRVGKDDSWKEVEQGRVLAEVSFDLKDAVMGGALRGAGDAQ